MQEEKVKNQNQVSASDKADIFRSFLDSQNAKDIETINVQSPESITDIIQIAGATSRRHAQGLADGISQICRERSFEFLGIEGYDLADWILIDCNDVIVNIFQDEPRKLYKLEDLWSRKIQHRTKDNLS